MEAWGKGGGPDSQAGSEESQDSRVQVTETPEGDDFGGPLRVSHKKQFWSLRI